MMDLFAAGSSSSVAWQLAWQSTAVLVLGLVASSIVAMRPSRSHRILLVTALACLLVPLASLVARRLDVGLIAGAAVHPMANGRDAVPSPGPAASPRPRVASLPGPRAVAANAPLASVRSDVGGMASDLRFDALFADAWVILTAAALLRLAASFVGGLRLKAGATILDDRNVLAAAKAAANSLGLSTVPEVRACTSVRCPVVWCWGRRPVLILPAALVSPGGRSRSDWSGVLCHELAHWKRADHLSGLVTELLTCLIPWQPLAWVVRGRMAGLSELACDDWALTHARTVTPHDYAEALLGLALERRRPLLPAAVSRRSGLGLRVRHILEEVNPRPRTGVVWTTLVAGLAIGLVAMLALARTRQARAVFLGPPSAEARGKAKPTTIDGRVRGGQGEPIPGVHVYWVGENLTPFSHVTMPRDDPRYGKRLMKVLARGTTDARGHFSLEAPIEKATSVERWTTVVAHKPGLAPASLGLELDGKPIELVVEPTVPITGRLLGPGGDPASGVTVRLEEYTTPRRGNDVTSDGAMDFGEGQVWDERPAFYPREVRTDEGGRFVLDGFVPEGAFAEVVLSHPAYAVEQITVWTGKGSEPVPELVGPSVRPPGRDFTHTLAPARPVVGRVTDAETRAPLAGVTIQVTPMRKEGGVSVTTVTNSEGRYRVSDREGEHYWIVAYPARGSDYVAAEHGTIKWPEGESELRVDVALRRGVTLRGRIVDEETGAPVPYASVVYQPRRGNPHVRDEDDFRSPAQADAEGRFAVTGVPGPGVVIAEATAQGYIRRAVSPADFGHSSSLYVHGLARLDIPTSGQLPEITIKIKRGFTLRARVVRPDGSAPEVVRAWCPELTARPTETGVWLREFAGGEFQINGAEPGRTYRVFFLDHDQKNGTVAELKTEPGRKEPRDVRLQPTATLRGRVLDTDDMPIVGAQVLASIQLVDKGSVLSERTRFDDLVMHVYNQFTDEPLKRVYPAEFHYQGLIPGVRYFVTWYTREGEHFWRAVEALGPGEDRDVGDIRADRKEASGGD